MRFIEIPNSFLGIRYLLPEWKRMLSIKYFNNDLIAGITVALVAIPLSLAIALASGVSPGVGLITAIIAGIICALFGGAPLAVSGPAAAMSVLLADTVERFGVEGLVLMCLIAGAIQLLSGVIGLGKLARYVPLPVVAGFTAGIGVIILIGQLPRAFGLQPPDEAHIFSVFNHLKDYFHEINGSCLILVVLTMVIIRGLPKLFSKVQPILPAVVLVSLLAYFFQMDVPLIGAIPHSLPAPYLPKVPNIPFSELLLGAVTIYILASLETLLSASAIDKLKNGKKHNSNQELVGQGLGNIAVSFFGGIPVTSVIARSAVNVMSGAKTRRASVIHSLMILLIIFFLAPMISLIPIAVLAGVLFSIAFSMVNYKEFYELWKTSHSEGLIYLVTFFTIILVDLVAGVKAGIIAAMIIVLFRTVQSRLHISKTSYDEIIRLSLTGPLTFLSTNKLTELEKELEHTRPGQVVLLDLSHIDDLDTSGASAIVDLSKHCREKDIEFYITGLARRFESLFKIAGGETFVDDYYLVSEHDLRIAGSRAWRSSYGQLLHGVNRFYQERKKNDKRLFEYLAKRQNPHTLFITCSDSRVVPSIMTSSHPGDLFVVRNVGNYIPPYDANLECHSEFAAVEFALTNLNITDIVVCGHTDCGAMRACKHYHPESLPAKLGEWITMIYSQLKTDPSQETNHIAKINVLNQIENLKTYPIVKERLAENSLTLHAWFFEVDKNMIYEWDLKQQCFRSLAEKSLTLDQLS